MSTTTFMPSPGELPPVTVRPAAPRTARAIPPPPTEDSAVPPEDLPVAVSFRLDPGRIQNLISESREVMEVLAPIFEEEEDEPKEPAAAETDTGTPPLLPQLAAETDRFLRLLLERDAWTIEKAERLAEKQGVLLEGACEAINEAAIEKLGEALLYIEADRIEIEAEIREEVLS